MSQVGKYLNLKPHMQSWAVYNENGPYTSANKIGTLAPAQYGGLSYKILGEKGGDVYVIQTDSFGRCAIWAPRDNDSSITSSPEYNNGDTSGGGSGGGSGNGKYLNLRPHMQSWAVYNVNGPYTTNHAIGHLAPAQFGGLSYRILEEKGGDIYIIQTDSFGRCAIWAPRDNDSSITSSPEYPNGDTSEGGSGGGSGTGKYLNLRPHMNSWAVYNVNGPYTTNHAIGHLAPAQFGGLSYRILEEKGGDIYIIQTDSFGRCAIWAPRDNDSSITSSPEYPNGDTSGGGSGGGDVGSGDKYCRIYTRNEWGARPVIESGMSGLRTSPYKYIIIHHSAAIQSNSDMDQMKSIQNYHQSLDWGDIGYNYCIGKTGMVMQGRETKYVGAHTKGERNLDSIGICLFGDFENNGNPTSFQTNSLIPLLTLLCKEYGLTVDKIMGHKDFNSTNCPGNYLYKLLPSIREQVKRRLLEDSDDNNKFGVTNVIDGFAELLRKFGITNNIDIGKPYITHRIAPGIGQYVIRATPSLNVEVSDPDKNTFMFYSNGDVQIPSNHFNSFENFINFRELDSILATKLLGGKVYVKIGVTTLTLEIYTEYREFVNSDYLRRNACLSISFNFIPSEPGNEGVAVIDEAIYVLQQKAYLDYPIYDVARSAFCASAIGLALGAIHPTLVASVPDIVTKVKNIAKIGKQLLETIKS